MKTLAELAEIREKMKGKVAMRQNDGNETRIIVGMGTCGMVGPIGVYAGWVNDVAIGTKDAITGMDWLAMALICIILPAVLTWLIGIPCRRLGWIKEGDLKLD